jgi:hypothetical protein
MQRTGSIGRRVLCVLAALILSVSSASLPVAHAQSAAEDYEPPLIEHDVIERAAAAGSQEFAANVVDNQALADVILYYRFAGEEEFRMLPMTQVAASAVYSASVESDINDARSIEYYIQARDEAGNRVVKGFAFSPLVRLIGDGSDVQQATVAESAPKSSSGRRWLYIGLGVLAVGAIAAAANSGGSDDPPTGDFQIVLDPPQ